MSRAVYLPTDEFWSGYAGLGKEDFTYLKEAATAMPYGYSDMRGLPERVDPRLDEKFVEGWMRVENQGGVGAPYHPDPTVEKADGSYVRIGDVKVGDKLTRVNSLSLPTTVTEIHTNVYTGNMVRVMFTNEKELHVTEDHEFFVKGKGTVRAIDLDVGDECKADVPNWVPVSSISTYYVEEEPVVCLTLDGEKVVCAEGILSPNCFFAGQMVTMADGSRKAIETLQVGDRVITHKGREATITSNTRKRYTGDKVTISLDRHAEKLVVTADHEMLVADRFDVDAVRHDNDWIRREAAYIKKGDRFGLSTVCAVDNRSRIDLVEHLPETAIVTLTSCKATPRSPETVRYVDLTPRLCWLLGYYAGNGYTVDYRRNKTTGNYGSKRVWFAFDRAKPHFKQAVYGTMHEVFGIEMAERKRSESQPNNEYLYVGNKTIGLVFESLCGSGAANKRVPVEVFGASKDCREAFLRGYCAADGHQKRIEKGQKKTRTEGTYSHSQVATDTSTVSNELGYGIQALMRSVGIDSRSRIQPPRGIGKQPQYLIGTVNSDAVRLQHDSATQWVAEHCSRRSAVAEGPQQWTDSAVLREVTDVQKEYVYDEWVYCVEVSRDETIVVQGSPQVRCQGYGLIACVEYLYAVLTGEVVQLSPLYAYLMSQYFDGISGDRGSTLSGGTKLLEKLGLCLLEEYPLERRYPRGGYKDVPQSAIEAAKAGPFRTLKATKFRDANEYRAFTGSYAGIAQTGTKWTSAMANPPSHGVIQSVGGRSVGGHSWNFCGFMPIEDLGAEARRDVPRTRGEFMNIATNSHNTQWGDGGFGYFTDELFNELNREDLILGRTDMGDIKPRPSRLDFTTRRHSRFVRND